MNRTLDKWPRRYPDSLAGEPFAPSPSPEYSADYVRAHWREWPAGGGFVIGPPCEAAANRDPR